MSKVSPEDKSRASVVGESTKAYGTRREIYLSSGNVVGVDHIQVLESELQNDDEQRCSELGRKLVAHTGGGEVASRRKWGFRRYRVWAVTNG